MMMAADEKKTSPKKEPASKPAEAAPKVEAAPKADAAPKAEKADAAPKRQGMGEGQKPVTQAYKDNWNAIFGKKKKR
jgi:translation initiation factor IF-2